MPDSPLPFSGLWFIVPDFDLGGRDMKCSVSGFSKRTTDVGVFRPALDYAFIEGEGTFDISQAAIEDAAQLLGWISPEQQEADLADLRERLKDQGIRNMQDARKLKRLELHVSELQDLVNTERAVADELVGKLRDLEDELFDREEEVRTLRSTWTAPEDTEPTDD